MAQSISGVCDPLDTLDTLTPPRSVREHAPPFANTTSAPRHQYNNLHAHHRPADTGRSPRHRGTTMSATPPVKNRQLFINGEWCDSATGKKLGVVNPATEETIADVSFGNRGDAARAV